MIAGLNLAEVLYQSKLAVSDKYVPTIKVIGIGKCGLDAVNYMIEHGVREAEYVAIDTDAKALASCHAREKVKIDDWFSPSDSSALKKAVDQETIKNLIGYSNIVFIVLGMGENTARHLAPLIAQIVQPMGQLLVAAVALPADTKSKFLDYTDKNLIFLSDNVHSLIAVPDNFDDTKIALHRAVAGIAEFYRDEGLVPCDLWDAAIDFLGAGMCLMGTASASGADRATIAAGNAINQLARQNIDLGRLRRKAIVNITSASSLQPNEVVEVMNGVKLSADVRQSLISAGTVVDETMGDELRVTVFEFTPEDQNLTVIMNQSAQQTSI